MPPPRSNVFSVKLPVGCTADDIIDGVARIVTIQEVYCVQHMGARNYEVTVNTRAAATTLIQFKTVRLGDQIVPLIPIGPASTSITCLFLPATVTNESLIRALTPHGQVTEVRNGTFKGQPSVLTGTRYIQMRMKEDNPVPNYIRVAGHRAVFDYPGVRRVCRRCRQEGHISTECSAPFCERCGIFGHESSPCVLPCRRCGQAHATTSCEVPHLYSSVAGGSSSQETREFNTDSFPPLQPSQDHVHKKDTPGPEPAITPSPTPVETIRVETPATRPPTQGKDEEPPQEANQQKLPSVPQETGTENESTTNPDLPEMASLADVNKNLHLSEESDEDMQGVASEAKRQFSSDDAGTATKKKKRPTRSPKKNLRLT
ncbi:uncharacterized protein LOC144149366 [Haemaphysalis longicornis]